MICFRSVILSSYLYDIHTLVVGNRLIQLSSSRVVVVVVVVFAVVVVTQSIPQVLAIMNSLSGWFWKFEQNLPYFFQLKVVSLILCIIALSIFLFHKFLTDDGGEKRKQLRK